MYFDSLILSRVSCDRPIAKDSNRAYQRFSQAVAPRSRNFVSRPPTPCAHTTFTRSKSPTCIMSRFIPYLVLYRHPVCRTAALLSRCVGYKCSLFLALASLLPYRPNESTNISGPSFPPTTTHTLTHYANRLAPPVSMASISDRSIGCRRNLAGSSLRSKNSPLAAATEPRSFPDSEPRVPSEALERPRGPCC